MNIQVTYKAKWMLKDNPKYVWTECKKLINTKTGFEIKKTIKGNQAGYYIDRRFTPLKSLEVELIKENNCPF